MAVMVRKFSQALIGLLVIGLLVQVVATFGPFPQTLVDTTPMQWIYDGVLIGCAVLCGLRAVDRREERTAWALIALGLLIYAGGNVYWSLVLANLEEAPFPSPADGLWLAATCSSTSGSCSSLARGCRASGRACGSTG
jgi:hypothetical protein